MHDALISQFIDDELALDEKIEFVDRVSDDREFSQETMAYLKQEKLLRHELTSWTPGILEEPTADRFSWRVVLQSWWRPLTGLAVAMVLALFVFTGMQGRVQPELAGVRDSSAVPEAIGYRFVLYKPAEKVEIIGSFTNWQRVPLVPAGVGGYWEVTLPVVRGEHKYTFVVDGKELLPDPTVAAREPDDFGTVNSILLVKA
ncbi:MAG: hypothetical protein ACK5PS_11050 [Desulfopila sp.]